MSRWVRIDVNLFNHPFFASKDPRSDLEAWAWLIANVAWKDTTHRIGSEMVSVPAGSIYTTLRHLQNQWHWKSDKRVRSFLARLQREDMIRTKTDAGKTQISICNYKEYQEPERKEDAAGTQAGRKPDAQKTPIHQNTSTPLSSSLRSEEAHEAIEAYKKMAKETGLPEMRSVSEGRKQSIKKRIADHGLPVVLEAIDRVGRSSFCHGDNDRGWKADFDFICQPSSFLSILEGKYDNRVVRMPQRERTLIDIARERAAQERETMNERIIDATANSF